MADSPKIIWDWGTAYDMFVSLAVLHKPAEFGLRGSWASSVRKRLSAEDRDILNDSQFLVYIPFRWVYELPKPKNALTVLHSMEKIHPSDRLSQLTYSDEECDSTAILKGVASRGSWNEEDRKRLIDAYTCDDYQKTPSEDILTRLLDWWSKPEEFGDRYLQALKNYTEVFFSEEEKRIRPALEVGLERAQALAGYNSLPELVEELSQGLRFEELPEISELILAPSYWATPLMFFGSAGQRRGVWLYGARPSEESLVPGEVVPDAMLRALKALSDPTRLRILHYLSQESLSPAELARRLRLRPPTVTHHLQTLRLAGLIQVILGGEGKEKKSFAARTVAVEAACQALHTFLNEGALGEQDKSG